MNAQKVSDCVWEIPATGKMRVPARIFASEPLMALMRNDKTLEQAANVATLPGIVGASLAMPDAHQGYGFPVGGVAAFDLDEGIISPGGVGFDINCGVRLLSTEIELKSLMSKRTELLKAINDRIPAGAGREGLKLKKSEFTEAMVNGVGWAVENGYADKRDKMHTEEDGRMEGADPSKVSERALARGMPQLGTLGSGNHFLELQRVESVALPEIAERMGLREGQIVVMVHCGSRGLGHQVCSDFIQRIGAKGTSHLADPELACAPVNSDIGSDYQAAMASAINFAFLNRQVITHGIREAFDKVLGDGDLPLVYDVCHNIAKIEKHSFEGKQRKLCVHRKGATRAFGPGREELPKDYRDIGQPVFIPGSMGTASYVLVGGSAAMELSWGSTAHGAGRVMSRHQAIKEYPAEKVRKDLAKKGIEVRGSSGKGLSEEAPGAYKDVDEVVRVSDMLGIGRIVAKLVPIGVVKG